MGPHEALELITTRRPHLPRTRGGTALVGMLLNGGSCSRNGICRGSVAGQAGRLRRGAKVNRPADLPALVEVIGSAGGAVQPSRRRYGAGVRTDGIRRILLGTFVRPAEETGTGGPRVEAVYGYLVRHERGVLLLDTGLGRGDDETEHWYRPRRIPLAEALAGVGAALDEVQVVVNCHLHFDHCGGNPLLPGTPVICQRRELAVAQAGDYTMEHLIDYPGSTYDLLDGRAEIWPGVHVLPTPGHVDGHQSVVVECADGSVVLAGQTHDTASLWTADALAFRAPSLGHTEPLPVTPAWMEVLLAFDPKRVVFAHDAAVWEPT